MDTIAEVIRHLQEIEKAGGVLMSYALTPIFEFGGAFPRHEVDFKATIIMPKPYSPSMENHNG
jgi:hypothetical protein